MFEENILQGMITDGSKIRNNSHKDSPDSPKHKRVKIDEEESKDKLNPKDNSSDETIKIKKEVPQDNTDDLKMVPIFRDKMVSCIMMKAWPTQPAHAISQIF
jgi:hypothetical protein